MKVKIGPYIFLPNCQKCLFLHICTWFIERDPDKCKNHVTKEEFLSKWNGGEQNRT